MALNQPTNKTDTKTLEKKTILTKQQYIIAGISGLLVIGILTTVFILGANNKDSSTKIVKTEIAPVTVSNSSGKLAPLKADQKNNTEVALLDYNQNPFDPETEKPSDRFISFKIRQGQKYRMVVNYSNIGDEKMSKGSLIIKLGPGLSLVKNSMKEDISGKETIYDTNVYSPESNIIKYGPGTSNQNSGQVNPGDAGKITLDVEMSNSSIVGDTSRFYSYLSDEGETKGKIDLVFFEVTPKN